MPLFRRAPPAPAPQIMRVQGARAFIPRDVNLKVGEHVMCGDTYAIIVGTEQVVQTKDGHYSVPPSLQPDERAAMTTWALIVPQNDDGTAKLDERGQQVRMEVPFSALRRAYVEEIPRVRISHLDLGTLSRLGYKSRED